MLQQLFTRQCWFQGHSFYRWIPASTLPYFCIHLHGTSLEFLHDGLSRQIRPRLGSLSIALRARLFYNVYQLVIPCLSVFTTSMRMVGLTAWVRLHTPWALDATSHNAPGLFTGCESCKLWLRIRCAIRLYLCLTWMSQMSTGIGGNSYVGRSICGAEVLDS